MHLSYAADKVNDLAHGIESDSSPSTRIQLKATSDQLAQHHRETRDEAIRLDALDILSSI